MKKYKIYGIGNALLDYEYKVNDKILSELSLDKGCMLLNDFEKHFKVHKKQTLNPQLYHYENSPNRKWR